LGHARRRDLTSISVNAAQAHLVCNGIPVAFTMFFERGMFPFTARRIGAISRVRRRADIRPPHHVQRE
jgi:hypothetical protein